MKRLTVSVDDMAIFRYALNDSDFDPAQYAVLCETAGADGISVTLTETQRGIQERDAHIIKRLNKTFLNFHIPPNPQFTKLALTLNPDMVTFVDVSHSDKLRISPVTSNIVEEVLPDILSDFYANNISVAVFCYPEVNILKQISKLEIDYVEFDCTEITMAADSNEQLVAYDNLNSATLAAVKLGMGVNCYGGINYYHLPELAATARVEDICMGLSILKRSMIVGVPQAIQEARQQILFHQTK